MQLDKVSVNEITKQIVICTCVVKIRILCHVTKFINMLLNLLAKCTCSCIRLCRSNWALKQQVFVEASGAPNDRILSNAFRCCFRLSGVLLKLCRLILAWTKKPFICSDIPGELEYSRIY